LGKENYSLPEHDSCDSAGYTKTKVDVAIYDSLGEVAFKQYGKWHILDCERALELLLSQINKK
jgi:hypothetical protein